MRGGGCRCRTVKDDEILSAVGRAVQWAVKNKKAFVEKLKEIGYFFPERVEELLEEEAFKRLPGEGETSSFVGDSEDSVALTRALVKVITVSENGVEIEMRDGTVIEE